MITYREVTERQKRQREFALALRSLQGMKGQLRALTFHCPHLGLKTEEATRVIHELELKARASYREYQLTYTSRHLVHESKTRGELLLEQWKKEEAANGE